MLKIGMRLYGYCGGLFGRDSYEEKRVEAIGPDWVVVRDENERPQFASCLPEELERYSTEEERKAWLGE